MPTTTIPSSAIGSPLISVPYAPNANAIASTAASSTRSAMIVPRTARLDECVRPATRNVRSASPARAGSTLLPAYPTVVIA